MRISVAFAEWMAHNCACAVVCRVKTQHLSILLYLVFCAEFMLAQCLIAGTVSSYIPDARSMYRIDLPHSQFDSDIVDRNCLFGRNKTNAN